MFCINCGKQIADTARFCNYCGFQVVDFDEKTGPTPQKSPISVSADNVYNPDIVENSVDLLKMSETTSRQFPQMNDPADAQSLSGDSQAAGFPDNSAASIPNIGMANAETSANGAFGGVNDMAGASFTNASSAPNIESAQGGANGVNVENGAAKSSQLEQAGRRYTFGHIVMCLAAAALMAIAAGVFAGLYFSVV